MNLFIQGMVQSYMYLIYSQACQVVSIIIIFICLKNSDDTYLSIFYEIFLYDNFFLMEIIFYMEENSKRILKRCHNFYEYV